jgi:hypothetical protein
MKTVRLVLVAGSLFLLTTLVASAAPPDPPHPGPATFHGTLSCIIIDTELEEYLIDDCSPIFALKTNSQTMVLHWTAKAQLPEGAALPENGAHIITYENSGISCWWDVAGEVLTTNYSIIITPNGQVNMECHWRPDKWQPE